MLVLRLLALAGQSSKCCVKEREANVRVCFLWRYCPWPRSQQLRHQSWLLLSAVPVRGAQNLLCNLCCYSRAVSSDSGLAWHGDAAWILGVGYWFALGSAGGRGWLQTLFMYVVCLSVEPAAGAWCAQRQLGVTSVSHCGASSRLAWWAGRLPCRIFCYILVVFWLERF